MNDEIVKKQAIGFSRRHLEMIAELKESLGINDSAIIRNALQLYHQKNKPTAYNTPRRELSPEEEADRNADMAEAKARTIRNRQIALCDKLGGKVLGNTCVYSNFSRLGVYEQTLPLDHLDEELVTKQFSPNREAIEKLIKAGKLKATLPVSQDKSN